MSISDKAQSTAFFKGKDLSGADLNAARQEATQDLQRVVETMRKFNSKPEVAELAGLITSQLLSQTAAEEVAKQTLENAADLPYAPGPANGHN